MLIFHSGCIQIQYNVRIYKNITRAFCHRILVGLCNHSYLRNCSCQDENRKKKINKIVDGKTMLEATLSRGHKLSRLAILS